MLKAVYVGKMVNGTIQICKVLDSDISTGASVVFNRATKKVETMKYAEKDGSRNPTGTPTTQQPLL